MWEILVCDHTHTHTSGRSGPTHTLVYGDGSLRTLLFEGKSNSAMNVESFGGVCLSVCLVLTFGSRVDGERVTSEMTMRVQLALAGFLLTACCVKCQDYLWCGHPCFFFHVEKFQVVYKVALSPSPNKKIKSNKIKKVAYVIVLTQSNHLSMKTFELVVLAIRHQLKYKIYHSFNIG